jgi:hypothetical protein
MKEQTSAMYPVRRLIELKDGNITAAAQEIACSPGMLQEALRLNKIATVAVLAAECILRRQGPTETQAAVLTVELPLRDHGEFRALAKPFSVRVLHFCDACLMVRVPWRNVGAVQEVVRHMGGQSTRAEES